MSRRRQILDDLAGRIAQIAPGKIWTIPGGAHTCISGVNHVAAWKSNPWQLKDLPAISWRDAILQVEPRVSDSPLCLLRIVFGAYLGDMPMSSGRALLEDMTAAVWSDPLCSGLAIGTVIETAGLGLNVAGNTIIGCRLGMIVKYVLDGDLPGPDSSILTADGEILTADGEVLTW